jgi:hypothetical protein
MKGLQMPPVTVTSRNRPLAQFLQRAVTHAAGFDCLLAARLLCTGAMQWLLGPAPKLLFCYSRALVARQALPGKGAAFGTPIKRTQRAIGSCQPHLPTGSFSHMVPMVLGAKMKLLGPNAGL